AVAAGVGPDDASAAAHPQGRTMAAACRSAGRTSIEDLVGMLDDLGFDPAIGSDESDEMITVAFANCPYRELAEVAPQVVCHLHRGLIEGFVEEGGELCVERFGTLVDREPCQVELSLR